MKLVLKLLATLLFSTLAFAHEGHNHDAPKGVSAPNGGKIQSVEDFYVEVLSQKKDLKIYFYDKDLKPLSSDDFTVSAQTEIPRAKKKLDLALKKEPTFYTATFDAKGAHRYVLHVNLLAKQKNLKEVLSFTVEP